MDFNLCVDPGALVNLENVRGGKTGVQLTDSDLIVNLGAEFSAQVSRNAITGVHPVEDPRPEVYFPMGLSAAAQKLGRDTVCVVTSYSGLVQMDFSQEVQGEGRPIEKRRESSVRQAGDYSPPSALTTWARVIGVIVALVLIVEAITHGLFLWVVIAIVVIILAVVARNMLAGMRAREAKRTAAPLERTAIPFRHLIVSVQDPDGLMRELNQRGAARSAT